MNFMATAATLAFLLDPHAASIGQTGLKQGSEGQFRVRSVNVHIAITHENVVSLAIVDASEPALPITLSRRFRTIDGVAVSQDRTRVAVVGESDAGSVLRSVSYTHLTLPTISSV